MLEVRRHREPCAGDVTDSLMRMFFLIDIIDKQLDLRQVYISVPFTVNMPENGVIG